MSEVYPSSSSSSSGCLYDENNQLCFEFQPQNYQLQYDPNSVTYEIVAETQEVQLEYVCPVNAHHQQQQQQQQQWDNYYEVESSSNQVGEITTTTESSPTANLRKPKKANNQRQQIRKGRNRHHRKTTASTAAAACSSSSSSQGGGGGGGSKSTYKHVPHSEKPAHLVEKRNARERRRVHAVNLAFVKLRKALPFENKRGKRISKVRVLQKAIDYIQDMHEAVTKFDLENNKLDENREDSFANVQFTEADDARLFVF